MGNKVLDLTIQYCDHTIWKIHQGTVSRVMAFVPRHVMCVCECVCVDMCMRFLSARARVCVCGQFLLSSTVLMSEEELTTDTQLGLSTSSTDTQLGLSTSHTTRAQYLVH